MKLADLSQLVRPENTVLLLGAGATMPSGAPSGAALARHLASKLNPAPDGDELSEVAGIFEDRLGRTALAQAVRARLQSLTPTGGLLALPAYAWRAIYSTNFDRLVEDSYRQAGRDLHVVRSNFDFSRPDNSGTALYKIHGCITQDIGLGDRARMLLTELDYDEVGEYRQALFSSLQNHMLTANTLVVGQSLRDAHLRDLAKTVAGLRQQGVQGRVFLLAFDYSEDRARLLEQRGIEVVPGSLDDLLQALEEAQPPPRRSAGEITRSSPDALPSRLAAVTLDVSHAISLAADPIRLYNGAPARYADIHEGLTIPRAVEARLESAQQGARGFFLVLAGAAGVGKTSLARRLLHRRQQAGFAAWEHVNAYPLNVDGWLEVETALRSAGRQGVLLVDDCAQHMTALNKLVDALGAMDRPFLRVVATINAGQWKTRTKSRYFTTRGSTERLSILTEGDIRNLVNLVDRQPGIRSLVEGDFLQLGHQDKVQRLRDRCSADMFVCLKNIFRTDSLDNILLQEYADLEEPARDVYRHVAAIQAMGGKVHRQLIMRLLGIDAGGLQSLLAGMEGVVEEYDIKHQQGLYGWTTRHDVIAGVIATYKFADQRELVQLIDRMIEGLNPTNYIELETARSIAATEMGIPRIGDREQQVALLRKLIRVVPGERTPRRRLIRLFLTEGDLVEAERAISASNRELGQDNIVDRYRAVLTLRRSEQLTGLLEEDRHALRLEAERLALACIRRQPLDRYNYGVLADVGIALAAHSGETRALVDAIRLMTEAEGDIPDSDFARDRRRLEGQLRRFEVAAVAEREDAEIQLEAGLLVDSEG